MRLLKGPASSNLHFEGSSIRLNLSKCSIFSSARRRRRRSIGGGMISLMKKFEIIVSNSAREFSIRTGH